MLVNKYFLKWFLISWWLADYTMVWYITILQYYEKKTEWKWLVLYIDHTMTSQRALTRSPSCASYGVSFVSVLEKYNCVLKIIVYWYFMSGKTSNCISDGSYVYLGNDWTTQQSTHTNSMMHVVKPSNKTCWHAFFPQRDDIIKGAFIINSGFQSSLGTF